MDRSSRVRREGRLAHARSRTTPWIERRRLGGKPCAAYATRSAGFERARGVRRCASVAAHASAGAARPLRNLRCRQPRARSDHVAAAAARAAAKLSRRARQQRSRLGTKAVMMRESALDESACFARIDRVYRARARLCATGREARRSRCKASVRRPAASEFGPGAQAFSALPPTTTTSNDGFNHFGSRHGQPPFGQGSRCEGVSHLR